MQDKPSVSKTERKELLREVDSARMQIQSNLPFVVSQFTETVEKIKTTAKHEMVAWTQAAGIKDAPSTLLLQAAPEATE
jgi:hypothetical protein